MKILIFSAVMMLVAASSFAQSDSKPKVKISDIMIQSGMQNYNNFNLELSDFVKLVPDEPLLLTDFSNYSKSHSMSDFSGMFAVTVGLTFLDKEKNSYKANPVLRLGIFNARTSPYGISFTSQESYRYDTLTSSATGEQYFIDSVAYSNYDMNYDSEHLGLTASLQFGTNSVKRVSLYAGVGIVAAFSFNCGTVVGHGSYSMTSSDDVAFYNSGFFSDTWNHEAYGHENKTTTMISAGIPLGFDFRVGKANPFWSLIHLVYEFRPSVTMTTIPELKTYTSTGFCNTLGFKVSW